MEHINQIHLRGIIGASRISEINGRRMAQLSVATNFAYLSADKTPIIETTWHSVVVWEHKDTESIFLNGELKRKNIEVIGRLRAKTFEDSNGETHHASEILANSAEIINE